ncbi:hypothetical protein BCCH1_78410 (plasmid) [Burkholderia contaminans]|nr:hypothetical protein BCCH1_78410 [Burkholderia contaminans]
MDATDVRATATRKDLLLDWREEANELDAAREHFDLGCWLYYYAPRIRRASSFDDRVDCARRLFEAGIFRPGYQFFTIFGFGEREFDSVFEMGDAEAVIEQLRSHLESPRIQEAFKRYGWPVERMQQSLF